MDNILLSIFLYKKKKLQKLKNYCLQLMKFKIYGNNKDIGC